MNKINKCDSCNNVYSHRQSLWRHKQNCNNKKIRADTASYPDVEKREKKYCGKTIRCNHIQRHMNVCTKDGGLGADKVQIQQPIKKPRNHATAATIYPEKREKPVGSLYELLDELLDEDDSKEIKIIINKISQLFQESKRGAKQNRGKLMILLDLLKDCEAIDDNHYEELYDDIENICN